jgi:hypothetical protein
MNHVAPKCPTFAPGLMVSGWLACERSTASPNCSANFFANPGNVMPEHPELRKLG